jgi:hypothetical protein
VALRGASAQNLQLGKSIASAAKIDSTHALTRHKGMTVAASQLLWKAGAQAKLAAILNATTI